MGTSQTLYTAVERLVRKHLYPTEQKGWVVAVSGGVDSMVLLHLSAKLAKVLGVPMYAVHVNHGLRERANRDEQFVQTVCEAWNIPMEIVRVDVLAHPTELSKGIEADARELRYSAMAEAAERIGTDLALAAHHADDQLETMVWRLIRGTSATGLAGMREAAMHHGILWLRPLLGFDKAELRSYAEENRIPSVEDETNSDTVYTRNYIRQEIVPRMKTLNPVCAKSAARFAEISQAEDAWLDAQAERVIHQATERRRGGFRIFLPPFRASPLPLQRRAIKILLYCLTSADWSYAHIESVLHLCAAAAPSSAVKLPSGISAWREYDALYIAPVDDGQADQMEEVQWVLDSGSLEIGRQGNGVLWVFECRPWAPDQGVRAPTLYELRIPRLESVTVRTARTGERVKLLWKGSKKIQDVYTDLKVPKRLRQYWPVFETAGEIIWLPGLLRSRCSLLQPDAATGWVIQARRIEAVEHRK